MIKAITGTKDILPSDIPRWKHLEAIINSTAVNFNYKEIRTEPLAIRVLPEQAVFLVGAKGDVRSSGASCADMAQTIFDILPARDKKMKVFDGPEHGTDLFTAHPELMDEIVNWLREIYF